jgi:Tat protein translocase TatB subunit
MNLGFPEMLFIFVIALLIFGPKKLPEIGRQVGKAISEFKRASDEFKSQLDSEIRQLELEETRQRLASLSSEPEVSTSPPEGTVAATGAFGEPLDPAPGAVSEGAEQQEPAGGAISASSQATTVPPTGVESSASSETAAHSEVPAVEPAPQRNA